MTDGKERSNGQEPESKAGTCSPDYQSSDWRTSCSETVGINLIGEEIEVQAAVVVLKNKQSTLYLDWLIEQPDRMLLCARHMAQIHKDIESVLTSNNFRPV